MPTAGADTAPGRAVDQCRAPSQRERADTTPARVATNTRPRVGRTVTPSTLAVPAGAIGEALGASNRTVSVPLPDQAHIQNTLRPPTQGLAPCNAAIVCLQRPHDAVTRTDNQQCRGRQVRAARAQATARCQNRSSGHRAAIGSSNGDAWGAFGGRSQQQTAAIERGMCATHPNPRSVHTMEKGWRASGGLGLGVEEGVLPAVEDGEAGVDGGCGWPQITSTTLLKQYRRIQRVQNSAKGWSAWPTSACVWGPTDRGRGRCGAGGQRRCPMAVTHT